SSTEANDTRLFVTIDTTNLTGEHYIGLASVISASTGGGSGQYAYAYAYNIYGLYDENIYFSNYSLKSDEGVRASNKSITYGGYFPSVCDFGNKLLVAYREASEHLSYNGKIMLLSSSNGGSSFSESTVLSISGRDYRDPELFVYKNKLVLRTFYRIDGTTEGTIQFLTSDDGVTWSEPITITPPLGTFARASGTIVTDANGVLIAGAYAKDDAFHPFLIMTEDLVNFETKILTDGEGNVFDGNETTCLFLNDGYYAFVRHNTSTEKGYLLKFDTSFVFKKKYAVNTVLNGMRALKISENECLITTRQYTSSADTPQRTAMFKFNNLSGFYPTALSLGGGTDTGYASIVKIGDTVYVAFYRDKYIFLRTYLYDDLSGAF
ncbi:MAG: exo-alpha-sialidase, partial [Clostridia bacterium]|nr:exo-alpha-sialidase [Clostridia bacterium]